MKRLKLCIKVVLPVSYKYAKTRFLLIMRVFFSRSLINEDVKKLGNESLMKREVKRGRSILDVRCVYIV